MSTRIVDVIKTYRPAGPTAMVHDGYFILSNSHPMKWANRDQWERVTPARQAVDLDRALAGLPAAADLNHHTPPLHAKGHR